jgi:hypothetical protein
MSLFYAGFIFLSIIFPVFQSKDRGWQNVGERNPELPKGGAAYARCYAQFF